MHIHKWRKTWKEDRPLGDMRSRERGQKPEPGSGWYRIRVKTSNTLRHVPQLVRGPDYFTEGHKVNSFIHSFI